MLMSSPTRTAHRVPAGFLLQGDAKVRGMAQVRRIKVGESRIRRQVEKLLADGWTKTTHVLVRDQ